MDLLRPCRRNPSILAVCVVLILVALLGVSSAAAQDPAAERLYREAERLRDGGDMDGAVREMILLAERFSGDRRAPAALLEAADLLRRQGASDRAVELLNRLQEKYGRHVEAASAMVAAAEIRRDAARSPKELEEALAGFRRVSLLFDGTAYPELAARARARYEGARLRLLLADADGALGELLAIVEDEAPSVWTAHARLELGVLLLAGDPAPALEILQRTADDPDAETAVRERARRRIELHHRRVLRPRIGSPRWTTASRFPAAGPELREPSGVAASDDGRVLLIDPRSEFAVLFDSRGVETARRTLEASAAGFLAGGAAAAQPTSFDEPFVAVDGAVVMPFSGGGSSGVGPSGGRYSFADPRGKDGGLRGISAAGRDAFGTWWLLARGLRGPVLFDADGRSRELWPEERLELVDLAVDDRGRVLLLDGREGRVLRIELSGERRVVARGDWKRPQALAVDAAGDIYVLDRGERRIDVFDAAGAPMASIGPLLPGGLDLRQPVDLAVDGSGRLYVADLKLPFLIRLE